MDREMQVGDIGTVLKFTIRDYGADLTPIVDVSTATTKQIIFQKPDGTTILKTAAFDTNGTDGVLSYTTVSEDIDESGQWKAQAIIVLPSGRWSTNIDEFFVKPNLSIPT